MSTPTKHDPLRIYVMGERAIPEQQATDDDITAMRQLLRGALEAGAAGFSTGRSDNHRTARGAETPASEVELQTFARQEGRVWLLITRPALAELATPLPLGEVARDAEREDGYVLLATGYPAQQPAP